MASPTTNQAVFARFMLSGSHAVGRILFCGGCQAPTFESDLKALADLSVCAVCAKGTA